MNVQVSGDMSSGVASLALGYVRFMSYLFGSWFFEMLMRHPWFFLFYFRCCHALMLLALGCRTLFLFNCYCR